MSPSNVVIFIEDEPGWGEMVRAGVARYWPNEGIEVHVSDAPDVEGPPETFALRYSICQFLRTAWEEWSQIHGGWELEWTEVEDGSE